MSRPAEEHFNELLWQAWRPIHDALQQKTAPNLVQMRELVLELLSFISDHPDHPDARFITENTLGDLVRWFDLRLETEPSESSGLNERREADDHRTRYCLVRDLVEHGVVGRKGGECPREACETAVAILRYLHHPAGRQRGGAGGWIQWRAIKDSYWKYAKDEPPAWALSGDEHARRIEVTAHLIQLAKAAHR